MKSRSITKWSGNDTERRDPKSGTKLLETLVGIMEGVEITTQGTTVVLRP